MEIRWQNTTKKLFDDIVGSLPQFHRSIAERLVKEKSEELAKKRESQLVTDTDLIQAFFQEVPPAFKDMMKRMFDHHNIDYSKYVTEKSADEPE